MKRFMHQISKYYVEDNNIYFQNQRAKLKISIFERQIILIDYIFSDIDINPYLLNGQKYLTSDNLVKYLNFKIFDDINSYKILVDNLEIKIKKESANIAIYKGGKILHGGELGSSDIVIPDYQFRCIGDSKKDNLVGKFNFPLEKDAHFYGLGDKGGLIERNNKLFRFFNRDSLGYDAEISDPLYKSVPFFIKEVQKNTVGLFFNQCDIEYMDFGKESPFFYSIQTNGGPFSYYFIDGEDYKDVIYKYYLISGLPLFPPLFSFGFLGSSMNYVESDDAQNRILKYFETIEKYDIPCEGMYVSSGYLKANDGKRYAFLWNKDKFPDYKKYLTNLSKRGYNLIMNIKPGILTTHPWYSMLAEKGYFIKDENGKPYVEFYWGGEASLIDFSNKAASTWWKEELKKQYLDHGCSGIWNDNNEFEIEDSEIPVSKIKSILPILMSEASFEAFNEKHPTKRAWNYSRSGYSGIQRYARTWSGDNCSNWKSLKFNQYQSISMGLSGLTFYGHDLGGFYGERPSEELLIRACESAVFQPRFVIHSWREDDIPTEPWTYKSALDKIRGLIRAHYEFIPYIYNAAFNSVTKGRPLDRSLKLEFMDDDNCLVDEVNSMFGEDILKVLFVNPNEDTRKVYLPKSTNWYSKNGQWYKGGSTIEVKSMLGDYQYFVREGSLICTTDVTKLKSALFKKVYFKVYPTEKGLRDGTYFEDDGSAKLELGKYNFYSYKVGDNFVEFTQTKRAIVEGNREFVFVDTQNKVLKTLILDDLNEGETITIKL